MVMWSCSVLFAQDSWVKSYGTFENDSSQSILRLPDGGFVFTGCTISYHNNSCGSLYSSYDIAVSRIDSRGNILWKKQFGGTENEVGNSIVRTSDGNYVVTGRSKSNDLDFKDMNKGWDDIIVIKIDDSGDIVWKRSFGGTSSEEGKSISATTDGGVVITGWTYSKDIDLEGLSKGISNVFVIKLDQQGIIQWKKYIGGGNSNRGNSIVVASDGDLIVSGETDSNDGDFDKMNKGKLDVFVIKLDNYGNIIWKNTFGGSEDDMGESVTADYSGNVLITGVSHSKNGDFIGLNNDFVKPENRNDIFVIKLDPNGRLLWKKSFGGRSRDEGYSLTTTVDNSLIVTGGMSSDDGDFSNMNKSTDGGSGRWDMFIIKLDSTGNVIWKRVYGGKGNDIGKSIVPTHDGSVVITGTFSSIDYDFADLDIGGGNTANRKPDMFVMKLDSNGNLNTSTSIDDSSQPSSSFLVTPNPLTSVSTISYSLDKQSHVRIEVVNSIGEVISVLSDKQEEVGSYNVPINTTGLVTGTYTIRLIENNRVTSTMVVYTR